MGLTQSKRSIGQWWLARLVQIYCGGVELRDGGICHASREILRVWVNERMRQSAWKSDMVNENESEKGRNIVFLIILLSEQQWPHCSKPLKPLKTFTPYQLLFRSSKDLLVKKFPQHTSEQLILKKYVFPGSSPVTMMLFGVFVMLAFCTLQREPYPTNIVISDVVGFVLYWHSEPK